MFTQLSTAADPPMSRSLPGAKTGHVATPPQRPHAVLRQRTHLPRPAGGVQGIDQRLLCPLPHLQLSQVPLCMLARKLRCRKQINLLLSETAHPDACPVFALP